MANAGPGTRLAQAALSRVVLCCGFKPSLRLQFCAEFFAWAGKTRLNKGNAHIGVNGTERIVRNVNLSEGCCTEKGGFPDVGFADQSDAHVSTPSVVSLLFFRGRNVVISLDLCDGDVELGEVQLTVSVQIHAFNQFIGVDGGEGFNV